MDMTGFARTAAPALLLLALAACRSDPPVPPRIEESDYRLKHPLAVEPVTAQLHLRAAAADGVGEEERRALHDFAAQFIRRGNGAVAISVGGRGADDLAARAFAQHIAEDLLEEGLKGGELRLQMVIGDPETAPGQATLQFDSARAALPPCGDWSETERNAPHANFGCALQRNIGAMVADPRDLVRPRDFAAAHSAQGDAAIDKMNRGAATWSVPLPLSATTKGAGAPPGGQ